MKRLSVVIITLTVLGMASILPDVLPSVLAVTEAQPPTGAAVEAPKETAVQQPINATRAAREEKAIQDARRQQLAEREAALVAKEQELKKLSAKLESQLKALEDSRKRLDDSMKAQTTAQKKQQEEKAQKMVKLFKTMRGEQAGKMIDTLHEDLALALLSRMDTKSVAKLTPFISQPRVIKWITQNLQEH